MHTARAPFFPRSSSKELENDIKQAVGFKADERHLHPYLQKRNYNNHVSLISAPLGRQDPSAGVTDSSSNINRVNTKLMLSNLISIDSNSRQSLSGSGERRQKHDGNPDLTLVDQEEQENSKTDAKDKEKTNQADVFLPKDLNPVKIHSDSKCSTLVGPKSHLSQMSSPFKKLEPANFNSPSKVVVQQQKRLVPVMPKEFQMSKYFSVQ